MLYLCEDRQGIMLRKVAAIYYSPVGGTELMTKALAKGIAEKLNDCTPEEVSVVCYDLLKGAETAIRLDDETVAVIGMPVYVGKIPLPGVKALRRIKGAGAMTAVAVSFGGRSYGNALYELRHCAEERNLRVIGAGAFMISYRAIRGSSRSAPPQLDAAALSEFIVAASGKIMRLAGCEVDGLRVQPAPLEVNGRMPVHKISRISPKAAEAAQEIIERINRRKRRSEWFL